jgi:hypothetical protein
VEAHRALSARVAYAGGDGTAALRALRELGFAEVVAAVPWRDHELTPGRTELGTLRRFLEDAQRAQLAVALRVGPYLGADVAYGGLPAFVLEDPAIRARTARGAPAWIPAVPRAWPVPSYAAAPFRAHVARWFAALGAAVAPFTPRVIVDDGGLIAHARGAAYDLDYHPDAVAWWREASGFAGEPPRAWDAADAARCLSWAGWKRRYASRVRRELAAAFPGAVADRGVTRLGSSAALPPPGLLQRAPDELSRVVRALAAGGTELDGVIERDGWIGAAVTASGQLDPAAAWLRPVITALAPARPPQLALVRVTADACAALATSRIDPVPPWLLAAAGLAAPDRWHEALQRALEAAGVPYAIVDEDAAEDELAGYRAVIAPTLGRVDRALWRRLRAVADAKRTVVVTGPEVASLDELGRSLADEPPLRRAGKLRPGSLEDGDGLAADLAALAGSAVEWRLEAPRRDVRIATDGAVVYVISDATEPVDGHVAGPAQVLRDVITGEQLPLERGRVTIALPARGARMFVIR